MFNLFKRRKSPQEIVRYTKEEIAALAQHVERTFGRISGMMEGADIDGLHVDLFVISPEDDKGCYTLVTCGMGARRMNIPDDPECQDYAYAELLMCLPRTWPMEKTALKYRWPMNMLSALAHTPVLNDTWLGPGHTVGFRDTFGNATAFNSAVLLELTHPDGSDMRCTLPTGKLINFYQAAPLYAEERDYAETHGTGALIELAEELAFAPHALIDEVNVERPCMLRSDFLDSTESHEDCIAEKQLPVDALAACSHIAIFLRWMIEHNLVCEEFRLAHEEVVNAIREGRYHTDLRIFMNHKLRGCLLNRFFTRVGQDFAAWYYDFDAAEGAPCYPGDVDAHALAFFGEEKYHSDEFQDEAYLFVPWGEEYYRGMSRFIDEKFRLWKRR